MAFPIARVLLAGLVLTVVVPPKGAMAQGVDADERTLTAAPSFELPYTALSVHAPREQGAGTHGGRPSAPLVARPLVTVAALARGQLARVQGHRPVPLDYLPRRLVRRSGDGSDDP